MLLYKRLPYGPVRFPPWSSCRGSSLREAAGYRDACGGVPVGLFLPSGPLVGWLLFALVCSLWIGLAYCTSGTLPLRGAAVTLGFALGSVTIPPDLVDYQLLHY